METAFARGNPFRTRRRGARRLAFRSRFGMPRGSRESQSFEGDESRSQGGVSAQLDFRRGREPTQMVSAGFGDQESGLGKVMLGGHVLHDLVGEPSTQRADGG